MSVACLKYDQTGPWQTAVTYGQYTPRQLGPDDVRLRPLFSPINPSDINMSEGRYAYQPVPPVVLGREGVAEVLETGTAVTGIQKGDKVICIAANPESGFWCSEMVLKAETLFVIPNTCAMEQASMLAINPLTAWALLQSSTKKHRHAIAGDKAIQNAANSGVGIAIGQLARWQNKPMIHVVRTPSAKTRLETLGFESVYTEEDLSNGTLRKLAKATQITLGLNAIGGEKAGFLAACLTENGQCLTYGAMSKLPLQIPNSLLLYKNISFHGFLRSKWVAEQNNFVLQKIYKKLLSALENRILYTPIQAIFPLSEYKTALKLATSEGRHGKIIFDCR